MVVGVLQVTLHLEGVQGLKEKRSIVQRLLARLRNRYPVSAAEVGDQNLWRSAVLGMAMVSTSEALIAAQLSRIEEELEASGLAEIVATDVEYIHC
jgi:uncharacterized protein YlxP (DUF503 family)